MKLTLQINYEVYDCFKQVIYVRATMPIYHEDDRNIERAVKQFKKADCYLFATYETSYRHSKGYRWYRENGKIIRQELKIINGTDNLYEPKTVSYASIERDLIGMAAATKEELDESICKED